MSFQSNRVREEISALCINVGCSSKDRLREPERAVEIEKFIREVSSKHKIDVVFSQDNFCERNLNKLTEDLSNNVPGSKFEKISRNIQDQDYVTIFVNRNKYEMTNIERETEEVLSMLRHDNLGFFDEARAVFVVATNKYSGQSVLLSSFHAKKNKITDTNREKHILEYIKLIQNISLRVGVDKVLVGTDINHKMRRFVKRNKEDKLFLKTFLYDYPNNCGRYEKELPVYDYFMHSSNLCSIEDKPKIFNVPMNVLDHHPLHTSFYFEGEVLKPMKTLNSSISNFDSINSNNTNSTTSKQGDSSQAIQPGRFIQGTKEILHVEKSHEQLQQFIQNGQLQMQMHSPSQMNEFMGSDYNNQFQMNNSHGSVQIQAIRPKQPIPKEQLKVNICPGAYSVKQPINHSPKFLCEICKMLFDSRQGLFIHFGKAREHFPCKEKFELVDDETKNQCLRVFETERGMKKHQSMQKNNQYHHNPEKPFPNLR